MKILHSIPRTAVGCDTRGWDGCVPVSCLSTSRCFALLPHNGRMRLRIASQYRLRMEAVLLHVGIPA